MTRELPSYALEGQGRCCGFGCDNCPYEPRHSKGSTKISELGVLLIKRDKLLEELDDINRLIKGLNN
jgi:hypothetical protein